MKNRTLILFFFLIGASLAGTAQGSRSSIMFKHRYEVLNTPDLALNSSVKFHPNIAQVGMAEMNVGGERSSRRYENALHKRNAGIGLTAAGGTCLIGGSALLAAGVIGLHNDNINNSTYGYTDSPLVHVVEVAFGTILAIAGTAMTIPGAILLARGQHDIKKYKDSQQVN
jgi:hypothetical protein